MNSANDKYSSLDRTLGAGKPVDPATRLSELLAQSLEELTRPFDPPRTGPHPARPATAASDAATAAATARPLSPEAAAHDLLPREQPAETVPPEEARIDADKALAELEAELFAAARQVDSDATIPHADDPDLDEAERDAGTPADDQPAEPLAAVAPEADAATRAGEASSEPAPVPSTDIAAPPRLAPDGATEPQATPDPEAARVIARVRRLMLVSMAVTLIAVGSVFGLIGYRIFKAEGTTAKTADKLPPSSPIPTDVTLSLPRGARVIQSAVSNDRLLITIEIDGRPEVRTFDVRTLQPIGRLDFSTTP